MADRVTAWLKQHAAGEKLLTKTLRAYFRDQAKRVVSTIGDLGLSIDAAHKAIDAKAETEKLLAAVSTPIIAMMATGADNVLSQARRPKSTKAFDAEPLKKFELPQWVQDELAKAFENLEGQDYWQEIQSSTTDSLADAVKFCVEQGYSMAKAKKYLKENFAFSDTRAAAIARTETTGAYNLGHQASYDFLHQSGDIAGKEWMAVVDSDTRVSHSEADGQVVAVNEKFTVGGESAAFPGDPSLSAKNRVNCRCTTAGVFND
jgi:uncharacterized protein with gpF-like domain